MTDALIESTDTLAAICDHVRDTFDAAEQRYRKKHPAKGPAAKSPEAMEE